MPAREIAVATPAASDAACRTGAVPAGIPREEAERRAALLKAVADPVRLRIISLIAAAPGREACVCELTPALEVAQPTVSHHLRLLTEAGVLEREKRGTWSWFRLVPDRLAEIAGAIPA
jgi:ArsR family transcriptional regulator